MSFSLTINKRFLCMYFLFFVVFVCVHRSVCVYLCIYVCVYGRTGVRAYARTYVCVFTYVCVSMHAYPLSNFPLQPVLHNWCNKGRGVCYPVCGMMHIKGLLLLIGKSSPCSGSGFLSHYLSGTLRYVRRHITVNEMC